jgi:hypothetical protein
MAEFQRIAERIAEAFERISRERKIDAGELQGIIADAWCCGNDLLNCYPGEPGSDCQDVAFFISLSSSKYCAPGDAKHYSFEKIWQVFAQHMQGHCPGVTRNAIIISDTWDAGIQAEWQANISQVQRMASVEGYLLTAGRVSQVF